MDKSTDIPEIKHEALAHRRGNGFIATCSCGWYGHDLRDRREATRAALEHEMRARQKRERLQRLALEKNEVRVGGESMPEEGLEPPTRGL